MISSAERRGNQHRDRRVTVIGMARQGLALARFFLSRGAAVTISDARSPRELQDSRTALLEYAATLSSAVSAHEPRFVLGEHPTSLLRETDLLCLSGGVSPDMPLVQTAKARGIPLSNDALLTLEECPCPVIGITGSAGKTTTTTLVGLMLAEAGFTVHVGGNIGVPLIDRLEALRPGDKVVMELSSFQLELFDRSPASAAVLNITPNHLDRHGTMDRYAAAKANILQFQGPGDVCILNADDDYTAGWLEHGRCLIDPSPDSDAGSQPTRLYFPLQARRLGFSLRKELPAGTFMAGRALLWRQPGLPDAEICHISNVRLRGVHNLANILAAACIAGDAGASTAAMASVASTFAGVEHRLEVVRTRSGVVWVNDSIATTPERTIAGLNAFTEPVILLAGGRDKHLPWEEFASIARQRVRHLILFGEAAGLIRNAVQSAGDSGGAPGSLGVTECRDLSEAVAVAGRLARPGEVVLLSPGGTSFDAYADFAARGEHFRRLVEDLP